MDNIEIHFDLHKAGIIRHHLMTPQSLRAKLHRSVTMFIKPRRSHLIYKSVGYHSFNLYAFAILKSIFPEHPFWTSDKFQAVLGYAFSEQYKKEIEGNIYGYPDNPPGFEIPFSLQVFSNNKEEEITWWLSQQLKKCFDFNEGLMTRNTDDPATHAARIYEATRIDDTEI